MSQSPRIDRDDIEHYGVFAPLARYMEQLIQSMDRIHDSLEKIEEALDVMPSRLKYQPFDGEHQ